MQKFTYGHPPEPDPKPSATALARVLSSKDSSIQLRIRVPRKLVAILPKNARERNLILAQLVAAGLHGVDLRELLALRPMMRAQMNLIRQSLLATNGAQTDHRALGNLIRTLSLFFS